MKPLNREVSNRQPSTMEPTPNIGPDDLLTFIMAAACGLSVANIYYAQPLLDTLAQAFGVSQLMTGLIITTTQLGYAAGLILLVPLGDLLARRRLVVAATLVAAVGSVGIALAPSVKTFLVATLVVGASSVAAQILLPFAAHLARDEERGRVVGRVMSGLLLGILLARTVSGLVADWLGWRAVYALAAALMLLQAVVLARMLPNAPALVQGRYRALLVSVFRLMREEPILRRRTLFGALAFAAFSAFWTTLPFLLSQAPYGFSATQIGLFGLFALAGMLSANLAGGLHDRGHSRASTGLFLGMILLAFVVMGVRPNSLLILVVGVVLLELGVQGTQVLNQGAIYQIRPEARSRSTTVYMSSYFLGGALGSASAAALYGTTGWLGTCILAGACGAAALLFWRLKPSA